MESEGLSKGCSMDSRSTAAYDDCLLDRLLIKGQLGFGANSRIYLAESIDADLTVAVKMVNELCYSEAQRPEVYESNRDILLSELAIHKQLDHPNILKLLDYKDDGVMRVGDKIDPKRHFYMVLEYAEKGTIAYYAREKPFSETLARYYFKQLIEGLYYLHEKGFAHRDVKLPNLLLSKDGQLKISDFGHTVKLKGKNEKIGYESYIGTVLYNPPEIDQKEYQGRPADFFMAGVALFCLLTGFNPFSTNASKTDTLYRHFCNKDNSEIALFWESHLQKAKKRYGHGFTLSSEVQGLISALLSRYPKNRPTYEDIKAHPWWNGPTPTDAEAAAEIEERTTSSILSMRESIKSISVGSKYSAESLACPFIRAQIHRGGETQSEILDYLKTPDSEVCNTISELTIPEVLPVYHPNVDHHFDMYVSELPADLLLKAAAVIGYNFENIASVDFITPGEVDPFKKIELHLPTYFDSVALKARVLSTSEHVAVLKFELIEGEFLDFCDIKDEFAEELRLLEKSLLQKAS